MDLLKTLLVYMTLTFATTVQGAPTPAPTEAPTVVPSAMTETVDTPAPEAEAVVTPEVIATITATAAPTLTPAPAPTMSPNPSYKLLKQGSRGDRVKKLQERLTALTETRLVVRCSGSSITMACSRMARLARRLRQYCSKVRRSFRRQRLHQLLQKHLRRRQNRP